MNNEIQLRICKNCTKIIIGNQRSVCDAIINKSNSFLCKNKAAKCSYDF